MQGIIAVIAVIIISIANFFSGSFGSKKETLPIQNQAATSSSQQPVVRPKSYQPIISKGNEQIILPPAPAFSLDTFIRYGPLEKEVFEETNRVVFEFGARVQPSDTQGQISFETKIEGFDNQWQETYSNERTVDLPGGNKQYTFLVRAKIKGAVDSTPTKRTFTIKASLYFNKVKISYVRPPTFERPSLIALNSQLSGNEKIKITGFQLQGRKGSFTIPQGVEKYDSSNPLFVEDIFIKPGDVVYISGAEGQMLGKNPNFRLNKCFGYFANFSNFTIPIPENCPRPREDRLPRYLSEDCRKYIGTYRKNCESINSGSLAKFNLLNDSICQDYISQNFTYPGCFANYSGDQDFLSNQWHIYMQRTWQEIMHEVQDTVYLLDQNGLFIDKYKY